MATTDDGRTAGARLVAFLREHDSRCFPAKFDIGATANAQCVLRCLTCQQTAAAATLTGEELCDVVRTLLTLAGSIDVN